MASIDEMMADLAEADAAGDYELANVIAAKIKASKPAPRPATPSKPLPTPVDAAIGGAKRGAGSLVGGLVRGAGSIGSTVLSPFDAMGITGMTNDERRAGIDAGLQRMGADTDSWQYGAGKLGAEVAGTLGVGGALAKGLTAAVPAAGRLGQAIASGGMVAGPVPAAATTAAKVGNMATRIAGGAITGGAAAGLVDPENAKAGAIVGGVLPPAIMAGGKVGQGIRSVVRGPAVPEQKRAVIEAARQTGFVIPPTQAKPTLVNRALEGTAGKISTQQNASLRNQEVTNRLIAQDLGLPTDVPITPESLQVIRRNAGNAYQAVSDTGTVVPSAAYEAAIDDLASPFVRAAKDFPNSKVPEVVAKLEELKSPQFDASSAVSKIGEMRELADEAYRAGRPSVGKAYKGAAKALEDAIEQHLKDIQAPAELLDGFRNARTTIAKTYTVEKALNKTTGTIDARKLAAELQKGKPITGGARKAAQFASEFPTAAQVPERMGSLPQTSPLDVATAGVLGGTTGRPSAVLGALLGRPIARGIALSGPVQNRLAAQPQPGLLEMLANDPQSMQLLLRSAPVVAAGQR